LRPWSGNPAEHFDKDLCFIYDIIEVIYSNNQTEHAVVLQRSDGLVDSIESVLCSISNFTN